MGHPFGDRASRSAEASRVLDYALKGYDGDIEAVRMGRRYYDPVAKRFLTPDGFFFEQPEKVVGSPIEGNLYGYAGNDPVNFVDPQGKFRINESIAPSNGNADLEIPASGGPGFEYTGLHAGGDNNAAAFGEVSGYSNASTDAEVSRLQSLEGEGAQTPVLSPVDIMGGAAAVSKGLLKIGAGGIKAAIGIFGKNQKSQEKAIKSLIKRRDEHMQKLEAFKKDPQKFDNKGHLKTAPNPQKVIDGRIRHLENEINNFNKQIDLIKGK